MHGGERPSSSLLPMHREDERQQCEVLFPSGDPSARWVTRSSFVAGVDKLEVASTVISSTHLPCPDHVFPVPRWNACRVGVRTNRGLTSKLYYECSHFTVSWQRVVSMKQNCEGAWQDMRRKLQSHTQRERCKHRSFNGCARGRHKPQGGVRSLQLMENVTMMNGSVCQQLCT